MSAHKYPDFSESSFFQIWSPEGRVVVNEVLNNPDLVDVKNFAAWQQDFAIDPEITKHDEKGFAIVNAMMREIDKGVMSDMRAPLGDSMPMEQGNAKAYTVPIAHFTTRHFHETKATMYDKKVRFEQLRERYGEYDAQLIASYAEKVQVFIDGMNMTLTNMGEQLMTNGYIYYDKGAGIHAGIHKADIPAANFLGACMFKLSGSSEVQTTWADTDALLIDSLNRLVEKVNTKLAKNWKWQLDMPKAVWDNYVKKNKQVMTTMFYRTNPAIVLNDAVASASLAMSYTDQQILDMLNERLNNITVYVHDTAQYDAFDGVVRGWKTGIVTLRPLGRAGMMRHTDILDAEYFDDRYSNPAIKDFYVPALGGLGYLNNTIWPNGRDLEYRTRYIYSATPSLDEFLYHFMLTTGTASSDGNWY